MKGILWMTFPNRLKDTCTQMPQYHLFKCNVIKFFFKKLHFQQTSLDVCISVKGHFLSQLDLGKVSSGTFAVWYHQVSPVILSPPSAPPSPGPNSLAPLTCSQASSTFSFNPSVIRLTLEQQRFQLHGSTYTWISFSINTINVLSLP